LKKHNLAKSYDFRSPKSKFKRRWRAKSRCADPKFSLKIWNLLLLVLSNVRQHSIGGGTGPSLVTPL